MEEPFLDIGGDSEETINPWSHNKKNKYKQMIPCFEHSIIIPYTNPFVSCFTGNFENIQGNKNPDETFVPGLVIVNKSLA